MVFYFVTIWDIVASYACLIESELNNWLKICLLVFISDMMFHQVTNDMYCFEAMKLIGHSFGSKYSLPL